MFWRSSSLVYDELSCSQFDSLFFTKHFRLSDVKPLVFNISMKQYSFLLQYIYNNKRRCFSVCVSVCFDLKRTLWSEQQDFVERHLYVMQLEATIYILNFLSPFRKKKSNSKSFSMMFSKY